LILKILYSGYIVIQQNHGVCIKAKCYVGKSRICEQYKKKISIGYMLVPKKEVMAEMFIKK